MLPVNGRDSFQTHANAKSKLDIVVPLPNTGPRVSSPRKVQVAWA